MFKKSILIFFTAFLFYPFCAFASVNLKIHRLDVQKFPTMKAYINVEQDGSVLDNLDENNLKAGLDGKKISVENVSSLEAANENVAIVFAVDTSGSMEDQYLKNIKIAIKKLVREKKDGDMVTLISFDDDVKPEDRERKFTDDVEQFERKVQALKLNRKRGSRTVLFKAVDTGINMLKNPGPYLVTGQKMPHLRYLVVLSDGKDEGEGFTLGLCIDKAKDARIPVFSLGFPSKNPKDSKYIDNMASLAGNTNGEYRKVKGIQDIIIAYSVMGDKILKQQVLELKTDNTVGCEMDKFVV